MGRRQHQRFAVRPTSEGVVRVFRDVIIQHTTDDEVVVISNEPGVIDTTMVVEIRAPHGADARTLTARVVSSEPLVVDSAVRHRVVLHVLTPAAVSVPARKGSSELQWESGSL